MKCKHLKFEGNINVNRIEDINRFQAEISINCADCGRQFEFLGLPMGLNFNGATVSADGLEVSMSIYPSGDTPPPIEGVEGFSVQNVKK